MKSSAWWPATISGTSVHVVKTLEQPSLGARWDPALGVLM